MTLAIIAAVAENGVIGRDNDLPWDHLKKDLHRFKALTSGHTVVMGRKTFESIGRPLPNRRNIVVTRSVLDVPDVTVAPSLPEALALCDEAASVFVIGGQRMYEAALPMAQVFHLTRVMAPVEGDVFFPEWDPSDWRVVARETHAADAQNQYPCVFLTLHAKTA
jgi:dihydrofolate reductase